MTDYSGGGSGAASSITIGTSAVAGGADGDILYNNGGVLGGFPLYDDTGAGNAAFALRKTMSGAATTSNFFSITATLPTVLSADANMVNLPLVGSAATNGFNIYGLRINIAAGYTNNSNISAIYASNASASGGGIAGLLASATITGGTAGIIGEASAGTTRAGVYGKATGAGTDVVGVLGQATGGTNRFGVVGTFNSAALPAQVAALAADNGAVANHAFIACDNAIVIFTVADGGTTYLGLPTFASPVSRTLSGEGGVGTDIVGGALTLRAGTGTGSAVPAVVYTDAGATRGGTGTSAITNVHRKVVGATEILANNTVTTIASCTLANNTVGAYQLSYGVEVFDGTDVQVEQGTISFKITNKGGVIANNTAVKFGNQQSMTAGTLAVTFTITAANPALIQVNANSSLTPSAGYPTVTFELDNFTQQAVVLA